jgi:YVTN family beta-propeller protein
MKKQLFFYLLILLPLVTNANIYVSNEKDHRISILDGKNFKLLETIKVGQRPRGVILSQDQKRLLFGFVMMIRLKC